MIDIPAKTTMRRLIMKKTTIAVLAILVTLTAFGAVYAQVPKEGTIQGMFVYSIAPGATKTLQFDKGTMANAGEYVGVFIGSTPADILHNASFHCIVMLVIMKGVLEDKNMCVFTRPDGDRIFVQSDGGGPFPTGVKRTHKLLAGTGKFVGIEGEGSGQPSPPTKSTLEGSSQGIGNWTVKYKLP
jgi:hypothetical protein